MLPAPLPFDLAIAVQQTKGFLPEDEGEALFAHAESALTGTWLEIGTYCGKSTLVLGAAARRTGSTLVTVDHHHGSEENQPGWEWHDTSMVDPASGRLDTFGTFRGALDSMADVCTAVVASTALVARWWTSPLSLLFLDGNHTEDTAQFDYATFAPFLVTGGTLMVHDVFPDPADGGQAPWHVVQRAVSDGFIQTDQHGSLRVLRRP